MNPNHESNSSVRSSRREFLGHVVAVAAATTVPYHFSTPSARAASANERLRFALIGVGGNGTRTAPVGQEFANLVALCDVDASHLEHGNQLLCDGKADTYADYREVLARDDIDVVQISTPDHWHAKILIEAMLTDWGAHHVDIARLGIAATGQNNDPVSVDGTAEHAVEFADGVPVQKDRYNTAQRFNLNVAFADGDVVMDIRHDVDNGILFEGEHGRLFVNRGKLAGKPVEELADSPLPEDAVAKVYRGMPMEGNDRPAHWANFLYAIENRVLPISDVHSHMKMLNVCHLAGICCRLGRKINWDQATEQIVGDELATSMLSRPYRDGYEIDM